MLLEGSNSLRMADFIMEKLNEHPLPNLNFIFTNKKKKKRKIECLRNQETNKRTGELCMLLLLLSFF